MHCGGCWQAFRDSGEKDFRPPCHSNVCHSSELMTRDTGEYLDFYRLLRSETLGKVTGLLLKRGRATEQDLQIIMVLDAVHKAAEIAEAKKRAS